MDTFDYVIVGAGSAGCVLANRLSADPGVKVALVEAGPSDQSLLAKLLVNIPAGVFTTIGSPRYNWLYQYEADPAVGGHDHIVEGVHRRSLSSLAALLRTGSGAMLQKLGRRCQLKRTSAPARLRGQAGPAALTSRAERSGQRS